MKAMMGVVAALALAVAVPASAADQPASGLTMIKIGVKDVQKSVSFYTKLGLKAGRKLRQGEQELKWDTPAQGTNIILVDQSSPVKLVPGTASFMIQVTDLVATAKALKDAGFADIGEPSTTGPVLDLNVRDPDGNRVELIAYPTK